MNPKELPRKVAVEQAAGSDAQKRLQQAFALILAADTRHPHGSHGATGCSEDESGSEEPDGR